MRAFTPAKVVMACKTRYLIMGLAMVAQDGKYDRLLRLLYDDIQKYETEVANILLFLLQPTDLVCACKSKQKPSVQNTSLLSVTRAASLTQGSHKVATLAAITATIQPNRLAEVES